MKLASLPMMAAIAATTVTRAMAQLRVACWPLTMAIVATNAMDDTTHLRAEGIFSSQPQPESHDREPPHGHHHRAWWNTAGVHTCGAPDPTKEQVKRADEAVQEMFGKAGMEMTALDLSDIVHSVAGGRGKGEGSGKGRNGRGLNSANDAYTLVDVPIVYHVLDNQRIPGAGGPGPSATTDQQLHFLTRRTNELFEIYDKTDFIRAPWATFVTDGILRYQKQFAKDCAELQLDDYRKFITNVADYEYKMHVIICETLQWSGRAQLPGDAGNTETAVEHNLVRLDYRAIACRDEEGNYLCNNPDQKSHTSWWRTRSTILAHEFGHLFGLYHTFQGSCEEDDGDGAPDTPPEYNPYDQGGKADKLSDNDVFDGCPGLLPYDENRNLYNYTPPDLTIDTCPAYAANCTFLGNNSCAACCTVNCTTIDEGNKTYISEEEKPSPDCCEPDDTTQVVEPIDTCEDKDGLDPLNNVMSYAPDWCIYELTPGQMIRMMSQVKLFKRFIFCNYASGDYREYCKGEESGCSATATSFFCQSLPSATPSASPTTSSRPSASAMPSEAPSVSAAPTGEDVDEQCALQTVSPIGTGITAGSTIGGNATSLNKFCGTFYNAGGPVAYYKVIGTGNQMKASTCGANSNGSANFDSKITVWCDCKPPGNCINGNDDDWDCYDFSSTVLWPSVSGEEYIIMVHGYYGAEGDFELDIEDTGQPSSGGICLPPPPPPSNDDYCSATGVGVLMPGGQIAFHFSNIGATPQPYEPSPPGTSCNSQEGWCYHEVDVQASVWYTFDVNGPECVDVLWDGPGTPDLQFALYEVTGLCTPDNFQLVAANDDSGEGYSPQIETAPVQDGKKYALQVDGYGYTSPYLGTVVEEAEGSIEIRDCDDDIDDDGVPNNQDFCPNSNINEDFVIRDCNPGISLQVPNGVFPNGCTPLQELARHCFKNFKKTSGKADKGDYVREKVESCTYDFIKVWMHSGIILESDIDKVWSCMTSVCTTTCDVNDKISEARTLHPTGSPTKSQTPTSDDDDYYEDDYYYY